MRTFKLNKLVRDEIVKLHQDVGGDVDYKVLDETAYLKALLQKIIEEASEINTNNADEILKEIADIQEAVDCILLAIGKAKPDLKNLQQEKRRKSGSLKKRHFINTVTLPDNEYWAHYYQKDPKRFPEVKND